MTRQDAEKIITEYLNSIFGFALKRCKNIHDAQDFSQEVALKAFRALLIKDNIEDVSKFIWTIAHNALSNYYRDSAKSTIGVSLDEVGELIADPESCFDDADDEETISRLRSEIAYLSRLQRRIVIAYYFENRKQADIATELGIPLGTVKWHLFEAKKELKRGMDTMRKASDLKFNPIKFSYGISGSVGTKSPDEFLRSALSQNICYSVRKSAKSVNEIADALGVSPVYVEGEVEYLEKYGLLKMQKNNYITNFIIKEPTAELLSMQDKLYKRAAELFANDLYDELTSCGILDEPDIICSQTDEPVTLNESKHADNNFILWSLIPYIISCSKGACDDEISFDEVATLRPDGAHNIFYATVCSENIILPSDYIYVRDFCGPYYGTENKLSLWRLDTEWSEKRIAVNSSDDEITKRILSLYKKEAQGELLSEEDCAWLTELGFIKTNGDYNGNFKSAWQTVVLTNTQIKERLIAIGEKIRLRYKKEFDSLKAPYVKAVLNSVPEHLKRVEEYRLQFMFRSDAPFIVHCIVALLNNGKLKLPTDKQKTALTTIIIPE